MLKCSNEKCSSYIKDANYVKIQFNSAIWIYCCWTCARDCNDG